MDIRPECRILLHVSFRTEYLTMMFEYVLIFHSDNHTSPFFVVLKIRCAVWNLDPSNSIDKRRYIGSRAAHQVRSEMASSLVEWVRGRSGGGSVCGHLRHALYRKILVVIHSIGVGGPVAITASSRFGMCNSYSSVGECSVPAIAHPCLPCLPCWHTC